MDSKTKAMAVPLIAGLIVGLLIGFFIADGGLLGEGLRGKTAVSVPPIITGIGFQMISTVLVVGLMVVLIITMYVSSHGSNEPRRF